MRGIIAAIFLFCMSGIKGQEVLVDSARNLIVNAEHLTPFYQKLEQAKAGNSNVNIVHIGDSHIQAGFFTSELRKAFQRDYGNAGRGLVFPYRLANTNGHMDVRFASDVAWERYRIITKDAPMVGIAGATIYTDAARFSVQLRCDTDNLFNQIIIKGEGLEQLKLAIPKEAGTKVKPQIIRKTHVVRSGDVLGKISRKYGVSIKQIKQWNKIKGTMIRIGQKLVIQKRAKVATYNSENFKWVEPYEKTNTSIKAVLSESITEIYLIKEKKEKQEKQEQPKTVKLYSLHLSNSQQGVTYDGIGYNGAKYADYLGSSRFFQQLEECFRPDLFIVSLGTNEAFDKVYALSDFRNDVIRFCKELELRTGCKNIVLATPPSALRNRKHVNKKLSAYAQVLKEVAQEHGYAVWDLYEIMGAEQGMTNWHKKGLAGNDRIHFREGGYVLQAQLLYDALMKNTKKND